MGRSKEVSRSFFRMRKGLIAIKIEDALVVLIVKECGDVMGNAGNAVQKLQTT